MTRRGGRTKGWLGRGAWLGGLLALSAWGASPPILLDWGEIDTSGAVARTQSRALMAAAEPMPMQQVSSRGTVPWLVQFKDVVREEWKTALAEAGAELKGYIPENAFLIQAPPEAIAQIGALPDVVWVGEYLPEYKRAASVRKLLTKGGAEASHEYIIILFNANDRVRVSREIAEMRHAFVAAVEETPDGALIRASLTPDSVEAISRWAEVQWIEPYRPRVPFNDVAVQAGRMNVSDAWLALGLTGAGQTVAVCDTGLDTGNTSTLHPDFAGRVTGFGWLSGIYRSTYSWADENSHGTHVAGSVLGSGSMSTGKYRGVAYEANLIMQGTQSSLSGIPNQLGTLFLQAYDNGARIHSNSWGEDSPGKYSYSARYLDQYVWSNKNFLVVMAAGNEGMDADNDGVVDLGSICSPGTAKNCIAVGASESYRTSGGYSTYRWGDLWSGDYPAEPIKSDYTSRPHTGNDMGLGAFSSRGPTEDGRIKPDIIAPGINIISTRSKMASGEGWGTVTGNTNYLYMGGTSMATPLVSGAAALTREWLAKEHDRTNPSAALVKALLLNGARNMAPGQYGTGDTKEIPSARPSNVQGWGHLDLYSTLSPEEGITLMLYDDNALVTGQTNTFSIVVSEAQAKPFILTMAYSDFYSTYGAGKKLVNDLDLTVETPSKTILYPNNLGKLDATNNVEILEFVASAPGTYTVRVNGRNVPEGGSQPYALVMRGPFSDAAPAAPTAIWAESTNVTAFTAAWSASSGATSYRLDVSENPAFGGDSGGGSNDPHISENIQSWISKGTSYNSWSQVIPAGTVQLTQCIVAPTAPANGVCSMGRIQLQASTGIVELPPVNTVDSITVGLAAGSTSRSVKLQKYNGSTWSDLTTWSGISTAGASYSFNVNDSSSSVRLRFASPSHALYIHDILVTPMAGGGGGEPSFVPGYSNRTVSATSQAVTGLTANTTYYFRARAVNDAGVSDHSPTGQVATLSSPSGTPPIMNAIPPQSATVGEWFEYQVTATMTDGDPILSYGCSSSVSSSLWDFDTNTGDFLFLPETTGTAIFQFTATDKDGMSDPVSMTVTVSQASPKVSFGSAKVYGEEGLGPVTLPVSLSYAANATVQVAVAGTALPDVDFTVNTTLVFRASGATTTNLVLTVLDDDLPEGPESARLQLIPVAGATGGAVTQSVFYIRDNDAFSIVSANLTSGDSQCYEEPGARIFEALCPDVVLIQEFLMTNGITYRQWVDEHFGANFDFFVESIDGNGGAAIPNGIISRWPIVDTGEWANDYTNNRDFPWVKISLPDGTSLYAVSVHLKGGALSSDRDRRELEAAVIRGHIQSNGWLNSGYVVVGGDLNLQNRSESALGTLTGILSDARKPADQANNQNSNEPRNRPYDFVLPSPSLDALHQAVSCWGHTFSNGMIFDTRATWNNGIPPPALYGDSGAANMQHMAVVKVFEFSGESSLPLEPPASVWAGATNKTAFTAAWSPVAEATGYRLDVSEYAGFYASGGGGDNLLTNPGFEAGDFTGWTAATAYSIDTTSPHQGSNAAKCSAPSATAAISQNVQLTGDGETEYELSFWYKCDNNGSGMRIWSSWTSGGMVSGDVLQPTTYLPRTDEWTQAVYHVIPQEGVSTLKFEVRVMKNTTGYLDDLFVGTRGGGGASFVPGYENRAVAGTSQAVTGLTANTAYYFRVRAAEGSRVSDYSSVAQVTTLAEVAPSSAFFTVGVDGGEVVVRWKMETEEGLAGFWVERWNGTQWVRVNTGMIAATGSIYAVVDSGAGGGTDYTYRLVMETTGGGQVVGDEFERTPIALEFSTPATPAGPTTADMHWQPRVDEKYRILRMTNLLQGFEAATTNATGLTSGQYIDPDPAPFNYYILQVDYE